MRILPGALARPALCRSSAPLLALSGPPPIRAATTWAAWAAYMGIVLFSEGGIAPGNSALHTEPETIAEALNLSLNFWFVLPTLIPSIAPVVDPSLEALFNVLIAWALCFFGFAIDERENEYPGGMLPYLTGALFLTNVFFLPMIALRSPKAQPSGDTTALQRLGESRLAAFAFGIVVPLLAVCWFGFGRADAFEPGFEARWASLTQLVGTDRLAFSFAADLFVFALFQGVLVPSDAERRGVDANAPGALAARFVPFFGLVAWLLTRPRVLEE